MTTIGVIADTHVPQRLPHLPHELESAFRGVEVILHAGDVNKAYVLEQLNHIAPTLAVAGNADLFRSGLPSKRVITIAGKRIGLTHGHGSWLRYLLFKFVDIPKYDKHRYARVAYEAFAHTPLDVIVFGHTHRPHVTSIDGVLMFNPGPIAPDYYETQGPQVGLLQIKRGRIDVRIIKL